MIVHLILLVLYGLSMVAAFGASWYALAYCALGPVLLGLSLVDGKYRLIPNGYVIAGCIIWLALVAILGVTGHRADALKTLTDGLLGGFVVAAFVLVVSLVMDAVLGKISLGGGDIKLLFMTGLFLGLWGNLVNLLVACVLGLVFGLVTNGRSVLAKVLLRSDAGAPLQSGTGSTLQPGVGSTLQPGEGLTLQTGAGPSAWSPECSDLTGEDSPDLHTFPFGPAIAVATWFSLLFAPLLACA